jgi:hypothetical protein
MSIQEKSAIVPARAKQAGEIRGRWSWTEGSVWTDRMLQALETGVRGGNNFFAARGLYSLEAACTAVLQSSRR